MLYTLCKVAFAAALLISNTEAQLPLAKRQANQAFCSTVKSRATQGAQHKSATAFCSSYISIPVSTSTQTVSTSTVTLKRTSIITSTFTVSTGNAGTSTSTVYEAGGVTTVTSSTCEAGFNTKRAAAATVPRPSALSPYPSGPTLSRACSCFSIATSTSTISVTATSTSQPKRTVTTTISVQATTSTTVKTTVTTPTSTATTNIPPAACTPSNYVQNGGFEAGGPGGFPYGGGVMGPGWSYTNNGQVLDNSDQQGVSRTGNNHARIISNGQFGDESNATIYQQVTGLTSGADYILEFWFADFYVEDPNQNCEFQAFFGDTQIYEHRPSSQSPTYNDITNAVTPSGTSVTLEFFIGCNNYGYYSVAIDDISLTIPS